MRARPSEESSRAAERVPSRSRARSVPRLAKCDIGSYWDGGSQTTLGEFLVRQGQRQRQAGRQIDIPYTSIDRQRKTDMGVGGEGIEGRNEQPGTR